MLLRPYGQSSPERQFPQANQDYEMERLMREQQAKLKLQSRYAQIEQERITERRVYVVFGFGCLLQVFSVVRVQGYVQEAE